MTFRELDLFNRTLDDMNVSLKYLQELAVTDFGAAFEVFKSDDFSNQQHTAQQNLTLNQNYYDLHCYDMFCQHTEHIIHLHKLLQHETKIPHAQRATTIPKHNIVRLNQLQFDIAWTQWDTSIKRIKQFLIHKAIIAPFKERLHQAHDINLLMLRTAKNIQMRFSLLGELCPHGERLDLLPRLEQIQQLYSLSTERSVLHAYLENATVFPEAILITLHENEQNDLTTELF